MSLIITLMIGEKMKKMVALLTILFVISTVSYEAGEGVIEGIETNDVISDDGQSAIGDSNDADYWALLVAVGVYANNPDMDRPSMLVEVENLYNTLLVSEHWKEDHIKVIKAENATVLNILRGFKWLDKMEDENDRCLVYLTTHGFPILWDLPPLDEEDGMDEALAAYRGFLPLPNPWSWEPLANPFAIITDDMINNNLNKLECEGLCVIVDSCHSGGFNDNWTCLRKPETMNFAEEIASDFQGRNRVIMTSVPEENVSYGSIFSSFLIEGMKGYADINNGDSNGFCSAEEIFWYAEPFIRNYTSMQPQIFDDYPGELPLTEVELPPSYPLIEGTEIGKTNTTYTYQLYTEDPEGDAIRYVVDWGDGEEESTDLHASGEYVNISHAWREERTYTVSVEAWDEKGAGGNENFIFVTMTDTHTVDQRHTGQHVNQYWTFSMNDMEWCAQSFVPSLNKISKVDLILSAWQEGFDVELAIRESLSGEDMIVISKTLEQMDYFEPQWSSFDFDEMSLTPGNEYYLICRGTTEDWGIFWLVAADEEIDPYENGTFYFSDDGGNNWGISSDFGWDVNLDALFVTYS